MSFRRIAVMLGLVLAGAGVSTAQNLKTGPPEPRLPAMGSSNLSTDSNKPAMPGKGDVALQATETEMEFGSQSPAHENRDSELLAVPLRITAARTSFLTEARIPIREFWGGRLRFSGVQQRFHAANLYSVLDPAYAEQVSAGPGLTSVVARARVNYGFGLQFRFGR